MVGTVKGEFALGGGDWGWVAPQLEVQLLPIAGQGGAAGTGGLFAWVLSLTTAQLWATAATAAK